MLNHSQRSDVDSIRTSLSLLSAELKKRVAQELADGQDASIAMEHLTDARKLDSVVRSLRSLTVAPTSAYDQRVMRAVRNGFHELNVGPVS